MKKKRGEMKEVGNDVESKKELGVTLNSLARLQSLPRKKVRTFQLLRFRQKGPASPMHERGAYLQHSFGL